MEYGMMEDGKVRDGHVIKGSDYTEINSVYEKILTQIPDWEPAKREANNVSVFNRVTSNGTLIFTEKE